MSLCTCMDDETVAQKLEDIKKVDYERIGERMFVEMDGERYVGIWGHFFGKASTEQAAKTLEGLLEKAGEGVGEKK